MRNSSSRFGFMVILLLTFSGVSLTAAESRPLSFEFYSENVGLDEKPGRSFENTLRVLARPTRRLQPYLGYFHLRYEAYEFSMRRRGGLAGLRWSPWKFLRLFYEYRYVEDSLVPALTRDDPRFGAVIFHFAELGQVSRAFKLISDSYGEGLWLTRYSHEPMTTAWSKLALRAQPRPRTFVDLYAEAFLQETADPALGRQARELRTGLRTGLSVGKLSLTLQGFHRVASWVEAPAARWRWLLAVGGVF